jgi:hypothetical protein
VPSSIPKPPAEWALKLDILITHISQFTGTKNSIGKRQDQADEARVDEEIATLRCEFAIVIPYEYGEDQSGIDPNMGILRICSTQQERESGKNWLGKRVHLSWICEG